MVRPVMGLALRDGLGDQGSMALTDYVEMYGDTWKADVVTACTERFDLRLETLVSRDEFIQRMADLRLEMKADLASVLSDLRKDITDLRIESKQELSHGLSTLRQEM